MLPFCVPPYVSHPPSHCRQLNHFRVRELLIPSEKMETFKPVGPRCLKTMSLGSYFDSTAILMIYVDMKD